MCMKVFRDVFAAIMIGIIGGLAVSVFSYYQEHKEGGILQTAQAIVNSFDVVAGAYSDLNEESMFADLQADGLKTQAIATFKNVDGSEESVIALGDEEDEPYSGILRFHVRANSDSKEDQELKMAVKDDVVNYLEPLLKKCGNVEESKDVIVNQLQNIYTTAVNTIVEQGYDYDVKVYITQEMFPAKKYGDLTFPAGNYQALRIDIGQAKGQNWWCVMFPPLCFVDESTAVVSLEGKEALRRALTSEEYEALYSYYLGDGVWNEHTKNCEKKEQNEDEEITIKGESFFYNWCKEHIEAMKE